MKKISTLFKKDPNNLGVVINEINPDNQWVFDGFGIATRKFDGTAPEISIPCQDPDPISGHWPHWVKCDRNNPSDRYFFEALDNSENLRDWTYELIGEKINGNPEGIIGHKFVEHGATKLIGLVYPITFENLKQYLETVDIEGIVFHHKERLDGRMCKIRKKDFGIKRN
jgi:hypothetical protein